jgi:diacylglycerol kinase (ATP)
MRRRWLAIVNPAAGRPGDAIACGRALARDGLVAGTEVTRAPGDASRIAREARDVDGVVAVGGDGTIHEILAGLDHAGGMLAVMPVGHGNSLARQLGIASVALARAALSEGAASDVDLLEVSLRDSQGNGRRVTAASTVAAGYVARVVETGRLRFGWMGRAAYGAASIAVRPRPLKLTLLVEGVVVPVDGCTGLIVNNTSYLANFRAFPDAKIDDGCLDVMGLAAGWLRQIGHNASILAGSRAVGPALRRHARNVEWRLEAPATIMIDGELYEDLVGAAIRVRPGACRCVSAA